MSSVQIFERGRSTIKKIDEREDLERNIVDIEQEDEEGFEDEYWCSIPAVPIKNSYYTLRPLIVT